MADFASKSFSLLVAMTRRRGIGFNNTLPWPRLDLDMKHFVNISKDTADPSKRNALIMGSKTWRSIPSKLRPLCDRLSIVITNSAETKEEIAGHNPCDVVTASSFSEALAVASRGISEGVVENIVVIGGAQVFNDALRHPSCGTIYMTEVLKDYECDVFMPSFDSTHQVDVIGDVVFDNGVPLQFLTYVPRSYSLASHSFSETESKVD